MRKFNFVIGVVLFLISVSFGQNMPTDETQNTNQIKMQYRHSIATSAFIPVSLFSSEPADYFLINYGYMLSEKSKLFIESYTWKYNEPLGTYGYSKKFYPGKVRAWGIGAGYQRFLWKNLFSTVEITPMLKQYYDEDDKKTQKGFQLYCQLILGYKFEFGKNRWFIEPAMAFKYWPIDTNYPDDFAEIEDGKPVYNFEPSLIVGFNF